ncbi:MAG: 50S ribosomal protein L13 [Candidatus Omnitrophica bacterium]|nr:50S ribosomal protein L13 [Candidatus Omnitrophota bacterium]
MRQKLTGFVKPKDCQEKTWHLVDAQGQVLGRLASRIARMLTGKTRTNYTPHVDMGEGVIVVNASQVRVTGDKMKAKRYTSFSGYPDGFKERPYERVLRENPAYLLKHAVKGMLPKTRLGRRMMTRFLVYPGSKHPHEAQRPKTLDFKL